MSSPVLLPHERLQAYRSSVELYRWIRNSLERGLPRGCAPLRDQITRASQSVVLNLAEGLKFKDQRRTSHLRIALGSLAECAAALELLQIAGVKRTEEARSSLLRAHRTLQGLLHSP